MHTSLEQRHFDQFSPLENAPVLQRKLAALQINHMLPGVAQMRQMLGDMSPQTGGTMVISGDHIPFPFTWLYYKYPGIQKDAGLIQTGQWSPADERQVLAGTYGFLKHILRAGFTPAHLRNIFGSTEEDVGDFSRQMMQVLLDFGRGPDTRTVRLSVNEADAIDDTYANPNYRYPRTQLAERLYRSQLIRSVISSARLETVRVLDAFRWNGREYPIAAEMTLDTFRSAVVTLSDTHGYMVKSPSSMRASLY